MEDFPGIASIPSAFSVEETVAKLKQAIAGKGIHLFSHIDHGAGAAEAGLQMRPAHILIFGNAKAGTPVMIAAPLLALDLPLKVLVWQDVDGQIFVSYNTPEFLIRRHNLPANLAKNISGVEPLIRAALV